MASLNSLSIIINTPDKVIWEGEAMSVSSTNITGPFDVLPLHSNFITVIDGKPIIIMTGNEKKQFDFEKAVLFVQENTVKIFANF